MKDLLWWIAGATATWLVLGFFLKDYDAEGLIFVVVSFIVTYFLQKRREENAE
jgi:membrane protein implicated in regulation of membrane protease activity